MAYTFSSLTAHFLKSVSFERIGRIQRQFVNQLCGVEERHVHQALWRTVTTARFNNRDHFATARNHFHFVATAQIARFRIQRVNKQDRFREGAVQFRHTASHTAGVPVLQTRPVESHRSYSSSGASAAGSNGSAKITALPSGLP